MVRGDKNPLTEVGSPADENEEIDRIMKEIEDLEQKMDSTGEPGQVQASEAGTEAASEAASEAEVSPEEGSVSGAERQQPSGAGVERSYATESDSEAVQTENHSVPTHKVVALRPAPAETMAETDAVPASDEPLVRENASESDGGLSLKVGGCTEVSLEFTRSGTVVSLSCTDEGLSITTDQGAEFRIPFKRAA